MKLHKPFLLIAFLILPFLTVRATQVVIADSLKGLLETDLEPKVRADVLADLAFHLRYSDFEAAVNYAREAIELSQNIVDTPALAKAHNSLGIVYAKNNVFGLALEEYQKSLDLKLEMGDSIKVATAQLNMGDINFSLGNYKKAEEYFQLARQGFERQDNPRNLIRVLLNLGNIKANNKESAEARQSFLEVKEIEESQPQPRPLILAQCLNGIAYTYADEENYPKAVQYNRDALAVAQKAELTPFIAGFSNNLADNLLGLDRYSESRKYLDQGLRIARELNLIYEITNNYRIRGKYFAEIKQGDSAYFYLDKAYELNDSLQEVSAQENFTQMQVAYDYERKQRQIESLAQEKAIEEAKVQERAVMIIALMVGLGLLVLLLIVVVLGNRRQRQANQMLVEKNNLIDNARKVLQERNEMLEELNREKDGLIHVVAHDLKSPLNKTLALTELIEGTGPLTPAQTHAMGLVKRVNSDAREFIWSLLDVNAIEHQDSRLKIVPIDLNQYIYELAEGFRNQADSKSIDLRVGTAEGLPTVHTDTSALNRIMDNLVSNTLKFSNPGSRVEVATVRDSDGVALLVRDNGPGISEADQEKMFRKFQKLTARPTGGESSTGLGLAIVKALADQIEVKIEVNSTLGKGTEFRLTFPLTISPPEAAEKVGNHS